MNQALTRVRWSLPDGRKKLCITQWVKASQGDTFKVIDKVNDWYAVKLDKPLEGIDAGWVKASDSVPIGKSLKIEAGQSSSSGDIYETLLGEVNKVKEKYRSNPYVSVSGFSINIGIPPSVAISFEFKK